jgi:hypothetical protein
MPRQCAAEVLESRYLLAVFTVTSLADNLAHGGKLTLRDAITAANMNAQPGAQDTIVFHAGLTGTIKLNPALGELLITQPVTIVGLGAKSTIIDAQHNSRVFDVAASAGNVTFAGLTVTGGKTTADLASGGGILFLSPGVLTLKNAAVTGNALSGTTARGAGIYSFSGSVTVLNSTISGNFTTGENGSGGGIFSENGAVTLSNSTLAGNSVAGYNAGGAALYTRGSVAVVTLTNSTVSANVDTGPNSTGGAINVARASVTLVNSIVSGNKISTGPMPDIRFINYQGSATFSASHSLIGVGDGTPLAPAPVGSPDANGNFVGTFGSPLDARLGPLANNGGPTQTMALLLGSPAINAGSNSLAKAPDGTPLKNDQRGAGFSRIIDTTVDMGSFEFHIPTFPLVVTTANDVLDNTVSNPNRLSLRDAVALANAHPGLDTITFASSLSGVPIKLSLGELLITGSVNIVGLGAKNTIIDAQHNSRVFDVAPNAGNVTFAGLTITGGKTTAAAEPGGGIQFLSTGSLLIENSAISGNMTTGFSTSGGGIYTRDGAVTLLNSTVSGNSLVADHSKGAGIFAENGNVVVTNSTLSGNSTAGAYGSGVAVYAANGNVTLTNSTVTKNSAGGGNTEGGGVMTVRGSLTVLNSIVSGNTIAPSPFTAADLKFVNYNGSATFTAKSSLIGVNSGTPLASAPFGSPDANGNLVGTFASPLDARLGPLADNGGQTQTHALLLGSPAINAGNNSLAVAPNGAPLKNDQRGAGFPRIIGGTVDMGSFEFQA